MSRIKTQKTQVYAVIAGAVVRFACYKGFSFGQDTFGKIDASCLDGDTKDYERGMRDPGEGSISIDLDDENVSHIKLLQVAESGEKIEWYIGSSHASTPPTYEAVTGIDLPEDRIWWSFKGYINPTAPDDIAADALVSYAFTIVRTSGVITTLRTVTP